jgi:hypothetical protein
MTGQSLLLALVVYLLFSAPWCPLFAKAGKRWWVALLPVVNLLVIMRIAGRPVWWVLLLFVPLLGIGVWTVVCLDVAERFGHGVPYTIGLVFLPFFFALWLGLGPDVYARPSAAVVTAAEAGTTTDTPEAAQAPAVAPEAAAEPDAPEGPAVPDAPTDGPDESGQRIGAGE